MSWFDKLEEPIRPLVKLLRDNGINTCSSCGHEMYVEAEYYGGDLRCIAELLQKNGYDHFKIEATLCAPQIKCGHYHKVVTIWIPKSDGKLSQFSLHKGSE